MLMVTVPRINKANTSHKVRWRNEVISALHQIANAAHVGGLLLGCLLGLLAGLWARRTN